MKIFFLLIAISSVSVSFGQRELEKLESGIYKYEKKDFAEALEDLNSAIMINPNNVEAYLYRALIFNEFDNNEGEINDYTKAIELLPDDINLYYFRGISKTPYPLFDVLSDLNKKLLKESIADINKSIALYNKSLKTPIYLDERIDKVIQLNNYNIFSLASAFFHTAYAKFYLKDYNSAIIDYTKGIELDPKINNVEYYYCQRAEAKKQMKNYISSIDDYTKALDSDPDCYYAYEGRAEAKYLLHNYPGAIEDFSKAIELALDVAIFSDWFEKRADAKYKMNDFRGAIADYTKAMEQCINKNNELYLKRGDAKRLIKDKEGACLDYSKAGELGIKKAYERIKIYCN